MARQIGVRPELTLATIMMLSSSAQLGDAARCRDLGVAAHLTKPIGQADLLRAISSALGSTAATGPAAQLDEPAIDPIKILRTLG